MTSASTSVELQGQRGPWLALVAVSALVGLFVFVLGLGVLAADEGFGVAAFILHHPGLLRVPLVVRRGEVVEVCVGETSLRDTALSVSSEILPTFSTPLRTSTQAPNVLVVFRHRYHLDRSPRRSVPALAFFADRFGSYEGPPRGGVIHGLVFGALRPDELRRAFAAWGVVVDAPSQAGLAWVSPDQLRQRFGG